jgi:DNA-binding response OmpR family regulator
MAKILIVEDEAKLAETLARIKAALRRSAGQVRQEAVIRADDLEMDIARHRVLLAGAEVELCPKAVWDTNMRSRS